MAGKKRIFIERGDDGKYRAKLAHGATTGIVTGTQKAAIDAVKRDYPQSHPDVERVRNTKTGGRDKWRKP